MVPIKNKCFISGKFLVLLFGMGGLLVAPLSVAANNSPSLLMAFTPDAQYMEGNWKLIPRPMQDVKAEIERGLERHGLRGFQGRDDSAPLSGMEYYWVAVSLLHRPDLQQVLSSLQEKKATPIFNRALSAGVIRAQERTEYERAIHARLQYDKEALQAQPFFSQHIARWSFHRQKGGRSRSEDVTGIIMDVSPMLARSPMTLLWYQGVNTVTSSRFQWASCMTGVTCFLAPHFEHPSSSSKYVDPGLNAYLETTADAMRALPDDAALQMMQGSPAVDKHDDIGAGQKLLSDTNAAVVQLGGSELPADVRPSVLNDKRWNMVALSDGSVVLSGARSHQLLWDGTQVRRTRIIPELVSESEVKVDPAGVVWCYRDAGGKTGRQFQSWNPATGTARRYPLPATIGSSIRSNEWTIVPKQGIAFRSNDNLFVLGSNGQWSQGIWNSNLRQEVIDSLEQTMPWLGSRTKPHFGDGLFWQSDRDVYGIDPRTAHVANSVSIPSAKLIFGSHSAQWGLVIDRGYKTGVASVFDLRHGQPRFEVATDLVNNLSSLARSAHGNLLALSSKSSNSVLVLDMRNEKMLAVLQAPDGYAVQASAFSWQGNRLWLYATGFAGQPSRMLVWELPTSTIDPARGTQLPDQLRCDESGDCY